VWKQNRGTRGPQGVLEFVGKRGGGYGEYLVSRSGYNEVLALEVLNVADCVKQRSRAELLHLYQLITQLLLHRCFRRACVYVYMLWGG